MGKVVSLLPEGIKRPLRHVRENLTRLSYYGRGRYCPVCESESRRFRDFGVVRRSDAQCVRCGALERHRLVWLYFWRQTDLFDGVPKKVLHVAPEKCFEPRLRKLLGNGYLTADLLDPDAMVRMDVTDIGYPDESFDVIYCSHVLEHVPDDRKAMREFFRVLAPDGWAILLVPITTDETYEDLSITSPEQRLKHFGQKDHVRRYGPDYTDRLREAGFHVKTTLVDDFIERDEAIRMGLTGFDPHVFYCTKE